MSNTTGLPAPVTMGLRAMVPGVVRTLVPIVIALVVRVGFNETAIDMVWLERALTVVVTMGYYVAVRLAERYWDKIGWLLGFPAQPVYVTGQVLSVKEEPTPTTGLTEPTTTTTTVETDEDPSA